MAVHLLSSRLEALEQPLDVDHQGARAARAAADDDVQKPVATTLTPLS
jgi:hypothetical protein